MRTFVGLILVLSATLFSSSQSLAQAPSQANGEASQKLVKPEIDDVSGSTVADKGSPQKDQEKVISLPTHADDARTQKILIGIASQAGWFPELKITVDGGLVTLKGKAKNAEQLQWLAKTADRIPTVIAVINLVELETPAATDLTPAWKEFKRLIEMAKKSLPLGLLALFLFAIFWFAGRWIARGISSLWGRHISNPFLLSTVTRLTMLPIWLLFFYLVLQTAGLSGLATTIIGGTGAVGIVIGFAFKDIAENYLSGLLLAIRSPFTKGDEIQIDAYSGYVQSLNMRGTTIIDYDGNIILIPNRIVIQAVIRNLTSSPKTRNSFIVGIGYNDSVTMASELIYKALKQVPTILDDPAPLVAAVELSASTVNLRVLFWYDSVKSSLMRTKSQAISLVKETLLANNISLPDESREVMFTEPVQIRILDANEISADPKERKVQETKAKARENLAQGPEAEQGGRERDVERISAKTDALDGPTSSGLLK